MGEFRSESARALELTAQVALAIETPVGSQFKHARGQRATRLPDR